MLTTNAFARTGATPDVAAFRPPAVPLVTCDPYFSIWSAADHLYDDHTRHWTGAPHRLACLVRIDGRAYRVMGNQLRDLPVLTQTDVRVLPTRTIYTFESAELRLTLEFATPMLPDDLDVFSRPLTYLTWEAQSRDGREHDVQVYFSAAAELAVDKPSQLVRWSRPHVQRLLVLSVGSNDQPVLKKNGDDVRIDWGRLYIAAPEDGTTGAIGEASVCAGAFVRGGALPTDDDGRTPRAANDEPPVLALVLALERVGQAPVSRHAMIAYDDEYSIQYFDQKLRPYWRRNGADAAALLTSAASEYTTLRERCRAFDDELWSDLVRTGGEKYAQVASLAYRQSIAACKLAAGADGRPLLFPKENFSNGCISTVDVIYPMSPQYLLFAPALAKASVVPVLDYAKSDRWKFPFAPHDLGTYPHATGQVYGGGERSARDQMPVEETGNMLILLAAIAHAEGNADFASQYWPLAQKWARFLKEEGFDPERQLCTDDFAGHLAHNVNLSAKAIEALGAYAMLCDLRGEKPDADEYRKLALDMANRWTKAAADGDHFRLAFDKPGTWSQKYNLAWDRALDLNLFARDVVAKDVAFYLKNQQKYGLPLDSRKTWTKVDWLAWTATLTGSRADFDAIIEPLWKFLNETPDRVPMTDFYHTDSGQKAGFQARPVVGGVFMPMLEDRAMWKKWSSRPAKG